MFCFQRVCCVVRKTRRVQEITSVSPVGQCAMGCHMINQRCRGKQWRSRELSMSTLWLWASRRPPLIPGMLFSTLLCCLWVYVERTLKPCVAVHASNTSTLEGSLICQKEKKFFFNLRPIMRETLDKWPWPYLSWLTHDSNGILPSFRLSFGGLLNEEALEGH